MKQFANVSSVKVPVQKKDEEGVIRRKSAGRPKKPNMQYVAIRLDKGLHKALQNYAQENHMNKSSVVAQALRKMILQSV